MAVLADRLNKAKNKLANGLIGSDIISSFNPFLIKLKEMPISLFLFIVYTLVSGLGYLFWGYLPSLLYENFSHTLVLSSIFPGRFGVFLNFVFFILSLFLIYAMMQKEKWNYQFASGWYIIHAINFIIILIDSLFYNNLKFGTFTIPFSAMIIILNLLVIAFIFNKKELFGVPAEHKNFNLRQAFFITFLIFIVFFSFTLNFKLNQVETDFLNHYNSLKPYQNNKMIIGPSIGYCSNDEICLIALKNLIANQVTDNKIGKYNKIIKICNEVDGFFYRFICKNFDLI